MLLSACKRFRQRTGKLSVILSRNALMLIIQLNEVQVPDFIHPHLRVLSSLLINLEKSVSEATIRLSRPGADIDAACGQLSQKLRQQ